MISLCVLVDDTMKSFCCGLYQDTQQNHYSIVFSVKTNNGTMILLWSLSKHTTNESSWFVSSSVVQDLLCWSCLDQSGAAKAEAFSHSALVLAYPTHLQVKAYVNRSRLSSLVIVLYLATNMSLVNAFFERWHLGDVFLLLAFQRGDHHFG